jgi:hypothetical protein
LEVVDAAKSAGIILVVPLKLSVLLSVCICLPLPLRFLLAKTQEVVEHSLQLFTTTSNKKKTINKIVMISSEE